MHLEVHIVELNIKVPVATRVMYECQTILENKVCGAALISMLSVIFLSFVTWTVHIVCWYHLNLLWAVSKTFLLCHMNWNSMLTPRPFLSFAYCFKPNDPACCFTIPYKKEKCEYHRHNLPFFLDHLFSWSEAFTPFVECHMLFAWLLHALCMPWSATSSDHWDIRMH